MVPELDLDPEASLMWIGFVQLVRLARLRLDTLDQFEACV
jgi:hypothetical protein